jgi:hypothetical protein
MRVKISILAALLVAAAPGWAHHGSAGFDQNKPVHLTGKVSQVEWTNPHVVIHLEAAGADGKVVTWLVNTLPPNAATRMGFPQSSFASGTELSIDGYQALDGSNHVNGTSIVFKDGKKITSPDCFSADQHCFRPFDGTGRIQ